MIEKTILSHLVYNEEYTRRVLPFLSPAYFLDLGDRTIFELITEHVDAYNKVPTREALLIELENKNGLNQNLFNEVKEVISTLSAENSDLQWLCDRTEQFCKDNALHNALRQAISIASDDKGSISTGAIPKLLSDALGVSFNTAIGHDYVDDAETRFDFYRLKESRIPFDLEYLNKITKGGLIRKTLNILLAGTGVGKTLAMCHMASSNLMDGKNVLYITNEMAEERIAERIDANLLNVPLDELEILTKEDYLKKVAKVKGKTTGKLVIKEYPTASASAAHFRHLLNELRLKKNFTPDIIYIDYLNICTSSRIKMGNNVNSYTLIKSIAEELRGLAIEFNVPIVSATQTNRQGYSDSDIGLEATSESFGLPMTVDFMIAIISNEDLEAQGLLLWKQLKNRYADLGVNRRFVTGVDRSKMRLFDAEQSAQDDLMNDDKPKAAKPVFDNTGFGEDDDDRKKKFKSNKFLV